jgi:hypothetical protein
MLLALKATDLELNWVGKAPADGTWVPPQVLMVK